MKVVKTGTNAIVLKKQIAAPNYACSFRSAYHCTVPRDNVFELNSLETFRYDEFFMFFAFYVCRRQQFVIVGTNLIKRYFCRDTGVEDLDRLNDGIYLKMIPSTFFFKERRCVNKADRSILLGAIIDDKNTDSRTRIPKKTNRQLDDGLNSAVIYQAFS